MVAQIVVGLYRTNEGADVADLDDKYRCLVLGTDNLSAEKK